MLLAVLVGGLQIMQLLVEARNIRLELRHVFGESLFYILQRAKDEPVDQLSARLPRYMRVVTHIFPTPS